MLLRLPSPQGFTSRYPRKDYGFLVGNAYGYGKAMKLPDGTLFLTYLNSGGHRAEEAKINSIRCLGLRIRSDPSGVALLPATNK